MQKQLFNDGWTFTNAKGDSMLAAMRGGKKSALTVDLPYDAMIHEVRRPDAAGGGQTGFYPGGIYHYCKKFQAPEEWKSQKIIFEFEGVYAQSKVYINGDYAGGCLNGYSNFYICADEFLKFGQENEIKVIANNSMEPNSRWYSGSGIYRNVNLFLGSPLRIPVNGVRVTPVDIGKDSASVLLDIQIENDQLQNQQIHVSTEILDENGTSVASNKTVLTVYRGKTAHVRHRLLVESPKLWDCEHPHLYSAVVSLISGKDTADCVRETFGIRFLSLDAVQGLRVNGKSVKLRGSCIHHDNGILGAATFACAEEKRCRELKAAGFNCIRSAHHPMSKEMLAACDRLGMFVMDELSDIWNQSKNSNDYSQFFAANWESDVAKIVDKDYNHPSVILYSTGNEIPEAGTARGAWLNRQISDRFKELDSTRYTTSAINGMLASAPAIPAIIKDIMQSASAGLTTPAATAGDTTAEKSGGSNELNSMLSILSGPGSDLFSVHPMVTKMIGEFADAMDIVGYNYLTARHAMEHELNPNRIILGSETYPADIVRLWDIVKKNPHCIGDMTWTGYDYLGEAGCGIFYYDGTANFSSHWPDRLAYIGDIDIIGNRRPISYLREIVFGLRKAPYLAVERVDRYGQPHSQTPWILKDTMASWTWPGFEGKPALVDVYSAASEVELFLNGRSLGKKPAGEQHGYTASYTLTYEPGELKVLSYECNREPLCCCLQTAGVPVQLAVEADRRIIRADRSELAFVSLQLLDQNGVLNPNTDCDIRVQVEGAGSLAGFGNANPQAMPSYDDSLWPTYQGRAMAAVRSNGEAGDIQVSFTAEGCPNAEILIKAEK